MKIISAPTKENPFLVLYKEKGLPSAPLFENDDSAFTRAAKIFPELLNVHGRKEVEHGLLHRLDNETDGLILIASTQNSYEMLIKLQNEGKFKKWYKAKVDRKKKISDILNGFPDFEYYKESNHFVVESFFRPFGKKGREVRPVIESSGRSALKKTGVKKYTTEITFLENDSEMAICSITAGYRHQVRCHLAWSQNPVKGDSLYNPESKGPLQFEAFKISFPHPMYLDEILTFENM